MERRFATKRDTWLTLIILGSVVMCALSLLPFLFFPFAVWMLLVYLLLGGTILLLLWVFFGTCYVVADGSLRIYHGPYRWKIALDRIDSVERVRLPWSAPALSMDRFRITYEGSRSVMVSPERQQEFLVAIRQSAG